MMPNPMSHNATPEYVRELIARIGRSQAWIAERSGISRRRIQYLVAGHRMVDGVAVPAIVTYPEQFVLETLAEAGAVFSRD